MNRFNALLGSLLLAGASCVQAQGAPFVCDATAYSIATGQLATAAYSVTTGIVSAEIPLGTPWNSGVAPAINNLGYNYQDNYLYAVARSSDGTGIQQLVRIGSAGAGAAVVVANISGLNPASPNLLTAAAVVVETPSGPRFYIAGENGVAPFTTQLYEINLTTGAATLIGAPVPYRVFDIAVRPTDGKVLFVASSLAAPDFTIYQWDTNTGLVSPYSTYSGPTPSNAGGIVFSRDGRFMLIRDLNNLNWLTIDLANGTSAIGASVPATPEHDAASCAPQTTNLSLAKANPGSFTVGLAANYTLTVSNSVGAVTSPATFVVNDRLPPNFAYNSAAPGAGVTSVNCVASGTVAAGPTLACTVVTPAGLAGGGSASFTLNVTPQAAAAGVAAINRAALDPSGGTPPPTVPGACTANGVPAGCAVTPPLTPAAPAAADMAVVLGATTPIVVRPGQSFSALTLTCTNAAGGGTALAATCVPTASAGTVSNVNCTPASGSNVAAGASLACTYDYTAPGTQGGADEAVTAVTFTGTTAASNDNNATNNVATLAATVLDAVNDTDSKPGSSSAQTTNLATNDQVPAGSAFTLQPGGTCASATVSGVGVATYNTPANGTCTVNYQACAPAPNGATCDVATLTATSASADLTPAFSGLPTVSAPGSAVNASIVCTNAGPAAAANATCTATAADSSAAPVAVTVGVCTASGGTAASLPAGATLTCAISYVTPGTAGGSDTQPVAVSLTGTTGAANDTNGGTTAGGNNSTTAAVAIIDAVNDGTSAPPGSVGQTTNVAANDQYPAGSTFTLQPGSTCVAPSVSNTGTATFNGPAASCTVNYRVCAPAPHAAVCDSAVLTVTSAATVADMTPVFTGLPGVSAPGANVSGTLVCSNIGAVAATAATCAATAVDSSGSAVVVTVGACVASSGSAASLPNGATLTCPVRYTAPGTPGGTDTTPMSVTVTGTTGATNDSNGGTTSGGNNSTAVSVAIIDALDDSTTAPYGSASTVNLLANDKLGTTAATAGAGGNVSVTLTPLNPLPAGITLNSATGVVTVAANTPAGTYPIAYQICASPALTPPQCDTATASVAVLGKIDVLKSVGVPLQVGATSFELPYAVVVGNAGPVGSTVFNVQADENLLATFGGNVAIGIKAGSTSVVATGGTCTANTAFNGTTNTRLLAGTDDLAGGQRCTIRFTVVATFQPGAVPTTPLNNSVYASGVASNTTPNPGYTFPGGTPTPAPVASTTDVSTAGTTPPAGSAPGTPAVPPALPSTPGADTPAPTPVTLATQQLGAAKRLVSILPSGVSAYAVTYEIVAANLGSVPATNVQISDNLSATFAPPAQVTSVSGLVNASAGSGASAVQCAVNPAFSLANSNLMTGQTSLNPGQSCSFRFTLVFAPNGATGPFINTAIVSSYGTPATSPGGTPTGPPLATDRSDSGTNPIGNNPGAPGDTGGSDDPTPLALPGAISGSVWNDAGSTTGGNRVRDPGEVGLAGFTVELVYRAGTVIGGANVGGQIVTSSAGTPATAVTGADGRYTLISVPAGDYQLRFRSPGAAGAPGPVIGVPVNGESNNPQPNSTLDLQTRTLLVTVAAGSTLPQQSLPVDPSGVVYDSTSRLPIGGARIELLGPGGTLLPTACLLPGQQGQLTTLTGVTAGSYRFDLVAGADAACPAAVTAYTIRVTPPAGYGTPPSRAIPPAAPLASQGGPTYAVVPQPTAPAQGQPTTYHLVLSLGVGSALVIHNHIPLDPNVAAELLVQKAADKTQAEIGDSVLYRIRVGNSNAFAVPNVRVVDVLPLGFRMISGSASLQIGVAPATPIANATVTGYPGPRLTFTIGLMAANSEATISYRVRLGLGADKGTGVNQAYVEAGATRSVSATAAVKVTGGVFSAEACVIGKVYVDCNHNKVQDRGEPGIPGIRLYMEDGTNITTDENGQYSICGIRPITHVLKIDPQSTPVGSRFGITSSRNAGDPESLFIDLKNGQLHRADFMEQSCFPKVLEQVTQRRKLGPVYVPQKQDGKDEPWGIQFNSDQHKLDRTPAANPADVGSGGGR